MYDKVWNVSSQLNYFYIQHLIKVRGPDIISYICPDNGTSVVCSLKEDFSFHGVVLKNELPFSEQTTVASSDAVVTHYIMMGNTGFIH